MERKCYFLFDFFIWWSLLDHASSFFLVFCVTVTLSVSLYFYSIARNITTCVFFHLFYCCRLVYLKDAKRALFQLMFIFSVVLFLLQKLKFSVVCVCLLSIVIIQFGWNYCSGCFVVDFNLFHANICLFIEFCCWIEIWLEIIVYCIFLF